MGCVFQRVCEGQRDWSVNYISVHPGKMVLGKRETPSTKGSKF